MIGLTKSLFIARFSIFLFNFSRKNTVPRSLWDSFVRDLEIFGGTIKEIQSPLGDTGSKYTLNVLFERPMISTIQLRSALSDQ